MIFCDTCVPSNRFKMYKYERVTQLSVRKIQESLVIIVTDLRHYVKMVQLFVSKAADAQTNLSHESVLLHSILILEILKIFH